MAGAAPPAFVPPGFHMLQRGLQLVGLTVDKQLKTAHVTGESAPWTPVPPAPVDIATAPTLITFGGALFLFAVGVDHKIHYNVQAAMGFWGGWTTIPDGEFAENVSAAVHRNVLYIFVRGLNNLIYYKTLSQAWTGWTELPVGESASARAVGSTPAVAADPAKDRLVLLVRGLNERVYTAELNGDAWQGHWTELAGSATISSAPAAIVHENNLIVVIRGCNNHIYVQVRNAADQWSNTWVELPCAGQTNAAPAAGAHGDTVYIYVRGTNNNLFRMTRHTASGKFGDAYAHLSHLGNLLQPIACTQF